MHPKMVIDNIGFERGAIVIPIGLTLSDIKNDSKIVLHGFVRYKRPIIRIYHIRNVRLYDYTL